MVTQCCECTQWLRIIYLEVVCCEKHKYMYLQNVKKYNLKETFKRYLTNYKKRKTPIR